jgi:hypothetical protein
MATEFLSWFFGFFRRGILVVIVCTGWESGKPGVGFPLFQAAHARAVEMGKSRRLCEIFKGRWKEWGNLLFGFPRFPRARHFHGPFGLR